MKYSEKYERDFKWYLSVRHIFNFDGSLGKDIPYDKNGISGKECFYKFDTLGKVLPTKHPNLVRTLFKVKGSVNLHIKMYSEDRAKGILPRCEFEQLCRELNSPEWFGEGVEKQKLKWGIGIDG